MGVLICISITRLELADENGRGRILLRILGTGAVLWKRGLVLVMVVVILMGLGVAYTIAIDV